MDRKTYLEEFSTNRKRIQRMLAAGKSYSEIARELRRSRQAVRKIALKLAAVASK